MTDSSTSTIWNDSERLQRGVEILRSREKVAWERSLRSSLFVHKLKQAEPIDPLALVDARARDNTDMMAWYELVALRRQLVAEGVIQDGGSE